MNGINSCEVRYTKQAYEKLKYFIMALSYKLMKEMTEKRNGKIQNAVGD